SDIAGLPLGVLEGYEYSSQVVELKPGQTMILFTDGITDALNAQNAPFLLKGIHEALGTARSPQGAPPTPTELGERLIKAVRQHSLGRSQHDDIALVCFGLAQEPAAGTGPAR